MLKQEIWLNVGIWTSKLGKKHMKSYAMKLLKQKVKFYVTNVNILLSVCMYDIKALQLK